MFNYANENKLGNPTGIGLFLDASTFHVFVWYGGLVTDLNGDPFPSYGAMAEFRHSNKINITFADGHVSSGRNGELPVDAYDKMWYPSFQW
jgi:prepilin-type processing-associated H-X9-DG protein